MPKAGMTSLLFELLGRFVLFGAIWWLLTSGRTDALIFGACAAAAAAAAPLIIGDRGEASAQRALLPTVLRLPRLLPFFLWESLRGGVDVALRAFRPRLPLSPAMIDYPLRLPPGPAAVMMASLVSLMPGTLAIISGSGLRVHVLDDASDYRHDLERLEAQVARVFGLGTSAAQAPAASMLQPDPAAGVQGEAHTPQGGPISLLFELLGRFVLFGAIWWLLTSGRTDALIFGACAAAAAAAAPLIIGDRGEASAQRALLPTVLRLPRLLPFFLWESLRGGVDVALRAFRPRLPLSPAMIDYPLRLPPGPAAVMMASLVSLMPGTLAIISGSGLRVHVLDDASDYRHDLERLEAQVARVFGLGLAAVQAPAASAPDEVLGSEI